MNPKKGIKRNTLLKTAFAALAIFICFTGIAGAWNFKIPAQKVRPADGIFKFSEKDFADGKAIYFVYEYASKQKIRFFLIKSKDSTIRAAFDACDVCFRGKQGYVQQGDLMVCAKCGMKFPTDKINQVRGGCNPSPLERTIQDGQVIISEKDVLAGAGYFK